MKNFFINYKYYLIIGIVIVGIGIFYTLNNNETSSNSLVTDSLIEDTAVSESSSVINSTRDFIYVDIKGEVFTPGVYKVNRGTRVFELIEIAGGLKSTADDLAINLAAVIYDESVWYIPSVYDEYPMAESADSLMVNINEASLDQLMLLPGVGEVTATKIVEYREDISLFSTIEDLKNVSGIGDITFAEIKEYITV